MDFERILTQFKKRRTSDIGDNTAESTVDRYITHIRTWKDWLSEERSKTLWQVEKTDLRLFAEDLIFDDMASSTVGQRVAAISIFYQDCNKMADRHEMPDVPANPFDEFDKQDKKLLSGDTKKQKSLENPSGDKYPYIEPKDVKELINNVPAPRLRNELVIRLMFDCGFRRGEMAHAKVEHVNEDNTITIPPRKSEGRIVGFRENTALLLDRWLNQGGRESMTFAPDSEYLFPTNDGEHISGQTINYIVKQAAENAEIQETTATYSDGREQHKITSHTLRHSFAMDKLKKVDVVTLQKLMGHAELDNTMIYVNMSDEEAKEKSKQFTDF